MMSIGIEFIVTNIELLSVSLRRVCDDALYTFFWCVSVAELRARSVSLNFRVIKKKEQKRKSWNIINRVFLVCMMWWNPTVELVLSLLFFPLIPKYHHQFSKNVFFPRLFLRSWVYYEHTLFLISIVFFIFKKKALLPVFFFKWQWSNTSARAREYFQYHFQWQL